jgi:hypothetical protein
MEEEEEYEGDAPRREERTHLPRYSAHGRDVRIEAGNQVEDLNITFRDQKYQAPSGSRPQVHADPLFDPPSFATGLDTSTPVRPASRTRTRTTRDPSVPVTYGGVVYASTIDSGSPPRRTYDDTALMELQDESFNNTISSVPSPPPRVLALPTVKQAEHRSSVPTKAAEPSHLREPLTSGLLEMHQLEQEAEAMEKAFLHTSGRGKQELRIMRKKAESFWEYGLTLRTFRHWLQSYEHERVRAGVNVEISTDPYQVDQNQLVREIDHLKMARTFSRWRDLKTRRDRTTRHAAAISVESTQRRFLAEWRDAFRRRRHEQLAQAIADRKEKEELRTAWRDWKTKRLGRRTDRWKESMREKEVIVIEARQKRVIGEAFKVSAVYFQR